MKYFSVLTLVYLLITSVSCKDEVLETSSLKSLSKKKAEKYYVSAESGLNYRQSPKDKILGKFDLNQTVSVIYRTGVFQDIEDNNKIIKGEWVGIQKANDTVYVFDGFLTKQKFFLDTNVSNHILNYYNVNYGKETILVDTKSDSLRSLIYYAKPENDDEKYGFFQMAVTLPRVRDKKFLYYGDLNNDGLEDMIIPVNTEGGGGGGNVWWIDLFVFLQQKDASFSFLTTKSNWEITECQGFIQLDKIENNLIYGKSSCYAEDDGRCCPSLNYLTTLKLQNKDLIVVNSTQTFDN